jgi:hypothetical protein
MSEPTQAQPAPQPAPLEMQVQIPQCDLKMVEGFARVWRKNAIILAVPDQTSKEFARDFANMVLKSFVIEQAQRIMKMQSAAATNAVAPSAPQKSLIIA